MYVFYLDNSQPKKICTLIGYKSCFDNSAEILTELAQAVDRNGASKENLHFDNQR